MARPGDVEQSQIVPAGSRPRNVEADGLVQLRLVMPAGDHQLPHTQRRQAHRRGAGIRIWSRPVADERPDRIDADAQVVVPQRSPQPFPIAP
jgi:hypothetical protein